MAHAENIRKMQQDRYAVNRAFHTYQEAVEDWSRAFHTYQEAVEDWSRASVELDTAHDRREAAANALRTFINISVEAP